MTAIVRISRTAFLMKPPHGAPCNRCGACCQAAICPLGQHVLGIPEGPGPCPALRGEPGETSCGLIVEPERYAPVKVAIHGARAMSNAAALLISAGDGCCARFNGEAINHEFNAELERLDHKRADDIEIARALWTGKTQKT